jgi:hypothetical protein
MSKVISFSMSDRYLAKIRSLYPGLTDNLAAKQFLTDRLDEGLSSSLDASLDDGLDDRVKTLVESWVDGLLDERLDATVGKLIGSLTERLARIETRLDESLDGSLDDMEPLLKLQREASIASHSPDEPAIVPPNEPNAIEPAIETVTPEVSPSPPSPLGTDAIEDSEKKIMESVGEPDSIDTLAAGGTSPTDDQNAIESDPANPPVTEAIEPAIEDEDKPWLTLEELLSCDYQDWPTSIEGLRVKAKREAWTKRKRGKAYEYQAKLPHHE